MPLIRYEFLENGVVRAVLWGVSELVPLLSLSSRHSQMLMLLSICECRDNGHRECRTFVMGVNEVTVQHVPWARVAFWTAKSMYQVAGCTTCHPIHVEAVGTRSNKSCACMQAGTTRLIRYIGPSSASQCLSAVYSTSVAFYRQKHSRIDTAVNHVIMKLWLDHLGTIFKPYRESWDISRQTSSPHPLTCTETTIPPSVRP